MATRMHAVRYFSFIVLLPYTLSYSPDDSVSYNEYSIGIGGGQYAYSDCSGTHTNSFGDAGVKITHKFKAPFRVGAAGSIVWTERSEPIFGFIYPDLALDFKNFSFGTTGLRVGSTERMYFEVAAWDQVPLFSGKGAFHAGIGLANVSPFTRLWFGTNLTPYSRLGLALQLELPSEQNGSFFVNGRYGTYFGHPEYGVSMGLRIRQY